jgi:hypothetical protein
LRQIARKRRNTYRILVGKSQRKTPLGEVDVNGRMLLKAPLGETACEIVN